MEQDNIPFVVINGVGQPILPDKDILEWDDYYKRWYVKINWVASKKQLRAAIVDPRLLDDYLAEWASDDSDNGGFMWQKRGKLQPKYVPGTAGAWVATWFLKQKAVRCQILEVLGSFDLTTGAITPKGQAKKPSLEFIFWRRFREEGDAAVEGVRKCLICYLHWCWQNGRAPTGKSFLKLLRKFETPRGPLVNGRPYKFVPFDDFPFKPGKRYDDAFTAYVEGWFAQYQINDNTWLGGEMAAAIWTLISRCKPRDVMQSEDERSFSKGLAVLDRHTRHAKNGFIDPGMYDAIVSEYMKVEEIWRNLEPMIRELDRTIARELTFMTLPPGPEFTHVAHGNWQLGQAPDPVLEVSTPDTLPEREMSL